MEYLTFEDLQAKIQEHYRRGEYEQALELATRETGHFPEQSHLLYYWRIAMAARTGNTALAVALLEEMLEKGFWYSDTLLRKSLSLKALQGRPEFERLVELNRRLREEDQKTIYPLIILRSEGRCQPGGPPCPVLLGLHPEGSQAHEAVDFWRPAAEAGWLVGAPQSSQAMWKGAYTWDDFNLAAQEIKKAYTDLSEKYAIDPERVVLAGHSLGGEAAMRLSLSGVVAARGFISFAPSGPFISDPESWSALIEGNKNPRLRGYVILGEEDESVSQEHIELLIEQLNRNGIFCDLEMVPHAGHDFAPEFESSLLRGLEFITQG